MKRNFFITQRSFRIIILPCPIYSIMSKLGVFSVYIYSLASLGSHGLTGPHVPVNRVWGTLFEEKFH